MTEFEAVIGLEVHVQLQTATKAFCACPTGYGAEPNSSTCPVCLGHPGALPVLNRQVVDFALRMGLATNCTVRPVSGFARKNYFYPDLPKGYQISQFDDPICYNGFLDVELSPGQLKRIGVTRIHIEEDAGKSIHDMDIDTLVDLNRSGVPLIEIVSEPDLRSAREAFLYLTNIRQIVMYLGICDGNLEEGSLRCDANVSIRPKGSSQFGTRTEIKNLNSFRNAEKAIEFEIQRQTEVVLAGGMIAYETRMWDAGGQQTRAMRSKEAAHDYRYFPEPDLGMLYVDHEWASRIRSGLPELPMHKKHRLVEQYGIPDYDAGLFVADARVADFFEACCALVNPQETSAWKLVSNWIMTEIMRRMSERKCAVDETGITTVQLAELITLIAKGTISSKAGKEVFERVVETGNNPSAIVDELSLGMISDEAVIAALVDETFKENPDTLEKFAAGKKNVFGFIVGQILKKSGGKADPQIVNKLVTDVFQRAVPNTTE
jgi:aspartyl-tRNA(Asn)/glutamyl-tRNA(Gln) amidotransferase subunit B